MAQDELPCAVLLAKDVRHPKRHRCGLVLAGNLHLRALDRRRKGQVSALDAGEIVDRQLARIGQLTNPISVTQRSGLYSGGKAQEAQKVINFK
jgi:hypothetical protein